ncbi:MAG: bifunctional riboflavin kinase/FAD synthetase [Bacteroidetes bacterium]|nr:bifunctional riboflavin kinase/FAD synthetase [Bacteroidota bacterium]
MKTIHSLEEFDFSGPVVLTQGTFDGVHLGHQKILNRITRLAEEVKGKSVLLTFYPHPRLVLYPEDNELKLLTTLREKEQWLAKHGIDYLIVLPFTKEFSRLTPLEFLRKICDHLLVRKFVIGYDHRFGRNREGSIQEIEEFSELFGYEVEEISQKEVDDCIVSSSKIRRALLDGNVSLARDYMGRFFCLTGTVVHGKGRGKNLGFPTANIQINDSFKLIPGSGVYAVKVELKGRSELFGGMMNIGFNPTFNDGALSLEVNIFNFTDRIYGQEIVVHFVARLREEIKFADAESLISQLHLDGEAARKVLETL